MIGIAIALLVIIIGGILAIWMNAHATAQKEAWRHVDHLPSIAEEDDGLTIGLQDVDSAKMPKGSVVRQLGVALTVNGKVWEDHRSLLPFPSDSFCLKALRSQDNRTRYYIYEGWVTKLQRRQKRTGRPMAA